MTLENLARIGRLQAHAATREEIAKLLAGAARSLKDAGYTANSDATRLTLAYTAVMESAQAALFANGYRPSKSEGGHHVTMVQSLVHTIGQAAARYLCYILSMLPLDLGFIWIGVDRRKQGWHDKIAQTVVVRAKDRGPERVRFGG